jgi:hypothetical protein
MEEEVDLFEDTVSVISVNSCSSGSARKKGKEYMSLSYCTVYDSAQDLQTHQSKDIEDPVMAARHEPVKSNSCSHENEVGAGVKWTYVSVVGINYHLVNVTSNVM